MNFWRTVSSLVLFLCFHMLQLVYGTTVVPLCKSGESVDNCTTAMVQTKKSPRVAPVRIVKCDAEMEGYCWNGQCMYLVDIDEHYCRCVKGYSGVRCTFAELTRKPLSEEYLALTIFLSLLLIMAIAVAAFFAYKWYKIKKLREPIKEYKEVNTQNV
ncbi:proepiregulin-like [Spea bombifrons]|uniref:proepiregulin-like n=1 Tax=Spea bombifrons TaxID=233779 RepID=UPI00234B277B|nr:proepiregulin-like [Spea bombifrons]